MKYSKLIIYTLFAFVITDVFRYLSWVEALDVNNATSITTFLNFISLGIFIYIANKEGWRNNGVPKSIQLLLKLWILWNIFNLLRGAFRASNYWDWKFLLLSSVFFSLVSLVFFIGKNIQLAKIAIGFSLKYLFPFGFLLIPLAFSTNEELYSRLMIPVSLFILFIPFLKFKLKLLIIVVALTSIFMTFGFRSNIIKIGFSVFVLFFYYFQDYIKLSWLRLSHRLLFIAPILFFALAIMGKYNVFYEASKKEGFGVVNNLGEEEDLMTDSRTFLYDEVLSSLNRTGNILIGESASGSYQSDFFYDDGGAMEGKRNNSEVGILNILLLYGVIGVVIYFVLLFRVSSIAIYHSSNILAKMLGLFIAFRWTYSFVEEYTQYDLNFYFFWIAIGMVSSSSFRRMSDNDIRNYFKSL